MVSEKRVLVSCGTSIATGTVAAVKVKEIAQEIGVPVRIVQCKAQEVPSKIITFEPHFIITTGQLPDNLSVPVFKGLPFLTGLGMDELKAKIIELLQQEE